MSTIIESDNMNLSGKVFKEELFQLADGLIWKNTYLANICEMQSEFVNQREVDQFMIAKKGMLDFDGIWQFDYDVLIKAGLTEEQALNAMDSKYTIPESLQGLVTKLQISVYLETDPITKRYINYTEYNNYYRMLNGLPDVEDMDFVYITDDPKIDPNIPVHNLEIGDCFYLEDKGYLKKWFDDPILHKKKYLQYIGRKRIDPYIARTAQRYEILWLNSKDSIDTLVETFKSVYDNCRSLMIRTYYRKELSASNNYYEEFIAMCILFMTLNQMQYKFLEADITREFYDLESLKHIYNAYGVPFYPSIPISYHKKIVKKINKLLSYKGSTRVFFELFDLFDCKSVDIFSYYILKQHKMDANGRPIFVYDKDGKLDKTAMYDIKFGQVRLYDNPPLELSDASNYSSFGGLTVSDPFWITDNDLMYKLYQEDFNYVESKYLGVQTTFEMMHIVYESSYFFKMLLDNRKDLEYTDVYYISTNAYHNIFNLTIYMCCLVVKKHGYEGVISSRLPIVAKHLGYNFKADITKLRETVLNDSSVNKDGELIDIIEKMNVNSLDSINNALNQIFSIRDFLLNRMWDTKDPDAYLAYRNIYNTLLTSDIIEDVYRLKDGSIAESFRDLLQEIDSTLYLRLETITDETVEDEMNAVCVLYMKAIKALQYIQYADGIDFSPLMDQVFLLLRFFKSAKSELTGYEITYTISQPGTNFFRLMSKITFSEDSYLIDKDHLNYLEDSISCTMEMKTYRDRLFLLRDKMDPGISVIWIDSKILFLTDMIHLICETMLDQFSDLTIDDCLVGISHEDCLYDVLSFHEMLDLLYEVIEYEEHQFSIPDEIFPITDQGRQLFENTHIDTILSIKDRLGQIISSIILHDEKISLSDQCMEEESTEKKIKSAIASLDDIISHLKEEYNIRSMGKFYLNDSFKFISENKKINERCLISDELKLLDEEKIKME